MRRLGTPRWVAVHVAVLVLVATFLTLGWWQMGRAAAGNLLSYGYAIQWPAFAVFAVWVWIVEMRKAVRTPPGDDRGDPGPTAGAADQASTPSPGPAPVPRRRRSRIDVAYDDSDDPELAAYNHYLAWRNAHPGATLADYPGPPQSKQSKELPS